MTYLYGGRGSAKPANKKAILDWLQVYVHNNHVHAPRCLHTPEYPRKLITPLRRRSKKRTACKDIDAWQRRGLLP